MTDIDYDTLRMAILQQAVKDYQTAINKNRTGESTALARWFMSDWGQALSGDKGELIIRECETRVVTTIRPNRLANKVRKERRQ